MNKDIMLFWMQWSWKWTQWKLLVQKYWYKMFETWAELRKLTENGSDLWKKFKDIIDSGHLVDASIVMEVIENFLKNISKEDKIIFDWIPRNMKQQELFEKLISKYWRNPVWINIKLTRKEALQRLTIRFTCVWIDTTNNPLISEKDCIAQWWTVLKRNDDNETSINKRLEAFENETQLVIDWYIAKNRMIEINWMQEVDMVSKELISKF